MSSNIGTGKIALPELFVKKIAIHSSSAEEIFNALKEYSELHNSDINEITYLFVKKILKNGLFFKMKRDIADEVLFEAVYWASTKETKRKIRPKDMSSVPKDKNNGIYTKLQKEMILAILDHFGDEKIKLEIELDNYLVLFYELSCIKRDRRKNDL